MRALVMGRFQPFHLGHLDLVGQAIAGGGGGNEVIVAITSAQFNYLPKDPFTSGERIEMIRDSLREAGVDASRCIVVPLENQFNIATWAGYLRASLPRFDAVYSGNGYVAMLLRDSGIRVVRPRFLDRDRYRASAIRGMMVGGGDWRSRVPAAVSGVIDRIDGVGRLRALAASDTNPTEH